MTRPVFDFGAKRIDRIEHELNFPIEGPKGTQVSVLTLRAPTAQTFTALPAVREFYHLSETGMPIPMLGAIAQLIPHIIEGEMMDPEINRIHPHDLYQIGVHIACLLYTSPSPRDA